MARPRKPTALLELSGAFKKDPKRRAQRENEPAPTGALGNPPAKFTQAQKLAWRELAALAPEGVLTDADRWYVEVCVRLMARLRAGEDLKAGELGLLMQSLGRLGLTPADRSRVSVKKDKTKGNPFAEFAGPAKP